jgi:hypothetical protein
MNLAGIPAKFPQPFGAAAGAGFIRPIPNDSQIGSNPGYASLHDGFVPLNATPTGAGGIPPFIQDLNGILNQLSAWDQWAQAGGPVFYDLTFAGQIGGYPRGAVLHSNADFKKLWISTADNNATDPDGVGAANWANLFAPVFVNAEFTGTFTVDGAAVFQNTVNLGANAVATTPPTADNDTTVATTQFTQAAVIAYAGERRNGFGKDGVFAFPAVSGGVAQRDVTFAAGNQATGVLLVAAVNFHTQSPGNGLFEILINGVSVVQDYGPSSMTLVWSSAAAPNINTTYSARLTMDAFGGAPATASMTIGVISGPTGA